MTKIEKKAWVFGGIFCAVFALAVLFVYFWPSHPRRALPESASKIQEFYSEDWPDYTRCLKARLPESDVAQFAENLGLTERFDPSDRLEGAENQWTRFSFEPSWWDPLPLSEGDYIKEHRSGGFQLLTYSKGFVYYLSVSW